MRVKDENLYKGTCITRSDAMYPVGMYRLTIPFKWVYESPDFVVRPCIKCVLFT